MEKGLVMELIEEIIERADEARLEENNDVNFGRKLAFNETLAVLQRLLISQSPDAPNEYGLGFDIDKRILFGGETVPKDWD